MSKKSSADGLNVSYHMITSIRNFNDTNANDCLRRLLTLNKKIARSQASQKFLSTCKSYGFVPRFLHDSTASTKQWFYDDSNTNRQLGHITRNFHLKLLELHISYHSANSNRLIRSFASNMQLWKSFNSIPPDMKFALNKFLYENRSALIDKLNSTKSKKLNHIKSTFFERHRLAFHDKWFSRTSSSRWK